MLFLPLDCHHYSCPEQFPMSLQHFFFLLHFQLSFSHAGVCRLFRYESFDFASQPLSKPDLTTMKTRPREGTLRTSGNGSSNNNSEKEKQQSEAQNCPPRYVRSREKRSLREKAIGYMARFECRNGSRKTTLAMQSQQATNLICYSLWTGHDPQVKLFFFVGK